MICPNNSKEEAIKCSQQLLEEMEEAEEIVLI
jgi:hypothetical protein